MSKYILKEEDLVGPFKGMPLEIAQLACDRTVEFRGYITLQEMKGLDGVGSLFRWSTTPEGSTFWCNISKGNYSPYYEKYHNKSPTKYQVKESDLIGDIKGFPIEVVQKMIERQVEQGNPADVTIFQRGKCSNKSSGGFNWSDTPEFRQKYFLWVDIIDYKNFDLFFKKYPKKSKETADKEQFKPKEEPKKFILKMNKVQIKPKVDNYRLHINCNNNIKLNFKN